MGRYGWSESEEDAPALMLNALRRDEELELVYNGCQLVSVVINNCSGSDVQVKKIGVLSLNFCQGINLEDREDPRERIYFASRLFIFCVRLPRFYCHLSWQYPYSKFLFQEEEYRVKARSWYSSTYWVAPRC